MLTFDWDHGNSTKCEKHGLTRYLIEGFFHAGPAIAPDPVHSTATEQRFIAVGLTPEGRAAFVAFCVRDGHIRPVSARYMHAREVARYAEIFPENRPRPDQ